MKKGSFGSLAALLAGAGLALAQALPPMPTPAVEGTQAGVAPMPAPDNAAPSSVPEVDRQPWNPSLKQGSERPYPELPRGWFSGLCPDLGEFWLRGDYLLWAIRAAACLHW